jgi:hypothetical protein
VATSYNTLTPQEIVAAPLTLWMAPIGTAFPAVNTPAASISALWSLVGTSGALDYDQAGITVSHNQTMTTWTSVGATAPSKVWRTGEELTISVTLADISPAQYAIALNDAAVTTLTGVSGVGSQSSVPLFQGLNVAAFALLARGVSALNNNLNAQYQVPCVYQSANPAPTYKLGAPAELALTFSALLDPNGGGFGTFVQQSS